MLVSGRAVSAQHARTYARNRTQCTAHTAQLAATDTADLAGPSDEAIPLPNVSSSVLVKVLEYCDHHQNDPLPPTDSNDADDARRKATEISEWDAKFIQVGAIMA